MTVGGARHGDSKGHQFYKACRITLGRRRLDVYPLSTGILHQPYKVRPPKAGRCSLVDNYRSTRGPFQTRFLFYTSRNRETLNRTRIHDSNTPSTTRPTYLPLSAHSLCPTPDQIHAKAVEID
ncbi:hypothetical protein WG66_011599 [Moniliophthora roreri]|nr:hypothetical protein WG66_011599 [Moniliophthora roreri]